MIFPGPEVDAATLEEMLRAAALPMPDGYTHLGLASINGIPTVVVTAEELPAMVWRDVRWQRAVPIETHS